MTAAMQNGQARKEKKPIDAGMRRLDHCRWPIWRLQEHCVIQTYGTDNSAQMHHDSRNGDITCDRSSFLSCE